MSDTPNRTVRGISSMATRQVLADLTSAHTARTGQVVVIESVGGVDAAKRVQAGEAFDLVILASDAIDKLIAGGHLKPGRIDLVRSGVAACVRAGAPVPDLSSEAAVKAAVLAADKISYSTGPSGVALHKLFERWGIADAVAGKTVQAPPGVPVASLVARGEVALGFQQLSELLHVEGITIAGPLPEPIQITTVFSAGVAVNTPHADAVHALLTFMTSREADAAKQRQGMAAA
ncbi:MAG: extracellular solute-binding protein [Hydrogenophaga sp.]|jgi:molybdate transport system substrate-binding protein|uniref:substrate-binding domain-containing protein n=1 Tax=Hydrogenophaga intermedia TaxID=65786 RepID=UPI002044963D|nr:substrate-binding domain-containing protein [Hydrogenophaga intermedia]MCM3562165.1 substrate-binding domain-containing protein [Hydrogenophaga intermedia]